MEGIYVGKVKRSVVDKDSVNLVFVDHRQDITHFRNVIKYDDTAYCLVPADDIIINNDELLRLREQVKQLEDECNEWKVRYSTVNNQLFQKGLAYGTLETTYKNEKIAGEMLLKDRDALKEKVEKLEAELMEIKTARTLREAYVTGVEKGCESLREERDALRDKVADLKDQKKRLSDMSVYWNNRFTSVMTDFGKVLEANGITFAVKNIDNDGNWDVVIDIPELNETKKKVEDLEKKLAASKSNENYWRDRKEEEEDCHHYWHYTFDRAVKQAADKGIHIGVCGTDEDCNAGIVTLDNMKAEDLEKQVTILTDPNKKLNQQVLHLEDDYQKLNQQHRTADNALEYWNNTYNDIVIAGKNVGVKIEIRGKKLDTNAGFVYVTNEKAKDLESQVVQMEDANQKLRQRISAADEEIEELKSQHTSRPATGWRNTYYSAVEMAKAEGVTIVLQDWDLKANVAHLKVMNYRAANLEKKIKRLEDDNSAKADALILAKDRGDYWCREHEVKTREYQKLERKHDAKWSAMMQALKDKGVEVIYMGEEDKKPIIDIKIPGWESDKEWVRTFSKQCADFRADKFGLESERDELKGQQCLKLKADLNDLKKEYGRVLGEFALCRKQAEYDHKKLEELKSKTVAEARYEFKPGCLTLIFTMCDGSEQVFGMDSSEAIDATAISCGTIPKCSSCAHYMHNPSRFAHDWCYMPIPKEGGSGYIRRLNKEEAEGPACSDFKAKKE